MKSRSDFPRSRRWVVKIGSSLLTNNGRGLDMQAISSWVEQITALKNDGVAVVLVSSGSVAEGLVRLGWPRRPKALHELQAAAAVGQMGLVQAYESCFLKHDIRTAQVLLTHEDLSDRVRYLNARSTLRTLMQLGVVPVINENDTVATEEIRFGDNDTLGALVANLVEADLLVILTDQRGMYRQDPRKDPNAPLLEQADASDLKLDEMAGGSGGLGRGGMQTKVRAGRLAERSGAATLIVGGREPNVLARVRAGENLGTFLVPHREPLAARKQWLAGQLQLAGRLTLDEGAVKVLRQAGRSLLPVGVISVQGDFVRGELVACLDSTGREVARGLVNYDALETRKIIGQPSSRIETLLGYVDDPELIHRDNLVLV
ncbi:MAG: glutamate 5-kinase [Chromatiales bacterium]|nr:glutamate 5-kinase [Chromatiales bacterium]